MIEAGTAPPGIPLAGADPPIEYRGYTLVMKPADAWRVSHEGGVEARVRVYEVFVDNAGVIAFIPLFDYYGLCTGGLIAQDVIRWGTSGPCTSGATVHVEFCQKFGQEHV